MCEYVHLPFQSGDDDVLKEMKRGYTAERYLGIINDIKEMIPDVSLTTDIIVGFPGETEEQFQNTLRLYEEVEFDNAFTAAYSPRPNTPAAEREDQVADLIKADRLNRLNEMVRYYAGKRSKRFMGRELEVLVEGPNPEDPEGGCVGKTRTNRLIFFPGRYEELKRKTIVARVTETRAVRETDGGLGTLIARLLELDLFVLRCPSVDAVSRAHVPCVEIPYHASIACTMLTRRRPICFGSSR